MKAVLHQPDARQLLRRSTLDDGLHQTAPDPRVLRPGSTVIGPMPPIGDARRENCCQDAAIPFCDHPVKAGIGDQHRGDPDRDLGRREIMRKLC